MIRARQGRAAGSEIRFQQELLEQYVPAIADARHANKRSRPPDTIV